MAERLRLCRRHIGDGLYIAGWPGCMDRLYIGKNKAGIEFQSVALCFRHVHVFDCICVGGATRRAVTKVTHLVTQRLVAELRGLLWCHIGSTHNVSAIRQ